MEKILKKINVITFLFIMVVMSSLVTYGYFTNINKFFEDSRKEDGNSGLALEREQNDFIVDGCGSGTMLDTVTGLCWLKNMNTFGTRKNWVMALTNCSNLDYAGHTSWDLPTNSELLTLIDEIGGWETCSTLGSFGFTNCQNGNYYWSGTEYQPSTANALYVDFDLGNEFAGDKTFIHYVTCVVRNP